MSDPTARNRLEEEASPYLRQHADNPVDWQPWDGDALAAARERDRPIFLSVGYSACHWCHVMEEESFEDEAVAEVLNDAFVPVKVDREERPDLDRVYQTVCQLVNGNGGWPLSAWLTPEGKPFYVGTYFPRDGRQGMPGFLEVCRNVANSWSDPEQRPDMEDRAEQWTVAAREEVESTEGDSPTGAAGATGAAGNGVDATGGGDGADDAGAPSADVLSDAVTAALRSADREHGGFGRSGPKFPQSGRIDLLLRAYARSGREEPLNVAVGTLDAMADGGLYDQVGGGFHRYCTDREWVVPHFEKMLYDNAELARTYLDAHRLLDRPEYALVGQETLAFLDRELSHPDGGFYGTLDADSGEGEGEFYVWTPDGVANALAADGVDDAETVDLVRDRYGVDDAGNFEGGTTVLTRAETVPDLAEAYDLATDEVHERLLTARTALYDYREATRERPPRDEKVLAGWNGLAVSAFAAGARTLDPELADRGAEALAFVREHLWDGERLSRRYIEHEGRGDVKGIGYLEDYAYLGRAALDLYGVTADVDHLAFALDLGRVVVDAFHDADDGTIYSTPEDAEDLVVRPQEPTDASTPSSLGVATRLLLDLDVFAPDEGFEAVARDVVATHADTVTASPLEHVTLSLAAARAESGPFELTLACEDVPEEWRETLANRYLPGVVVAPRPPAEGGLEGWLDRLGLDEAPPVWRGRGARDGEPTAYACRDFACSPPNGDLRAALEWAAGE